MPILLSVSTNALAAGVNLARLEGATSTSTLSTFATPYTCCPSQFIFPNACGPCQSTKTQPARLNSGSISQRKSHCSLSSRAWPISNLVPANAFIPSTNESAFPRRPKIWRRVALIRINSACVSASSCRDLLVSSCWRLNPIRLNWISPPTPTTTKKSATVGPHIPQKESYEGWTKAIANSAINPANNNPPQPHPHASHDSADASRSSSWAFITPFLRRHAGNDFRSFCVGIAVRGLMVAVLLQVTD